MFGEIKHLFDLPRIFLDLCKNKFCQKKNKKFLILFRFFLNTGTLCVAVAIPRLNLKTEMIHFDRIL